ncbi:hypothetical protein M422DRAFT_31685 [Sphaerobolus stellatus SS14]|uniref:Uncharacterized protein n=1 Tax=Sphaerobolus stellatus (strain SS14) TaxID=990650 RepID=A0A0C9UR79_SPHS4|nr:hypothetical protein M422DRAFT_36130 [Sphaerobolus stellatus SS14]KIJ41734.1 hypothetical protein M422DRAFT_31685 [Sphaerobolus stellatus SS14]
MVRPQFKCSRTQHVHLPDASKTPPYTRLHSNGRSESEPPKLRYAPIPIPSPACLLLAHSHHRGTPPKREPFPATPRALVLPITNVLHIIGSRPSSFSLRGLSTAFPAHTPLDNRPLPPITCARDAAASLRFAMPH